MSHACAVVVLPPSTDPADVPALVAQAMAPHSEHESDDGWWDWFTIGGRFTGMLDGYKPQLDPRNIETCFLCSGTGKRDDASGRQQRAVDPAYTCNGCRGLGSSVKWPTQWAQHEGDIARYGDVRNELLTDPPFTVVAGEAVAHLESWEPETDTITEHPEQVIEVLSSLSDECVAVIVDYHS